MYSKYIMFSYPQSEPLKKAYSNEPLQKSTLGYATNNVYQNINLVQSIFNTKVDVMISVVM